MKDSKYSNYYKLHFNLKQTSNLNSYTQIMLIVTCSGTRVRLYTGIRVKPRNWCKISQLCLPHTSINKREYDQLVEFNRKLNLFRHAIEIADNEAAQKGKYLSAQCIKQTAEKVKYGINEALPPLECLSNIIKDYTFDINRRGKKGILSTQNTYNSALKRLYMYERTLKKPMQKLEDFDTNFFNSFSEYLFSYRFGKNKEKKYTQNTVINTLKVIKNLLHRAYDKDLIKNDSFKKFQTTLPSDVTEPVYLTEKEIASISIVDVNNELEEVIRDAFVISCYTALRISDIYRINEAEISKSTISMFQSKTKEQVVIPILKEIGTLINKYRNKGFPKIHSGKLNNTVRELARRCNIIQCVTYREIRGGEVSLLSVPKYKLISFHTARRSCVTNLYKRGYPVNYIMTLSGHKSIQAFQRYMRASSKDIMSNFFSLLKKDKAIAYSKDE